MGVLFNNKVHVPGPVMFEPVLVITNVPWASGVQLADSERAGAGVGVFVGVAVGDWQKVDTVAGAAPPPEASEFQRPEKAAGIDGKGRASIQLKAIAGNGSAVQQEGPRAGPGHIRTGIGDHECPLGVRSAAG